jgi:hypothetical protein
MVPLIEKVSVPGCTGLAVRMPLPHAAIVAAATRTSNRFIDVLLLRKRGGRPRIGSVISWPPFQDID